MTGRFSGARPSARVITAAVAAAAAVAVAAALATPAFAAPAQPARAALPARPAQLARPAHATRTAVTAQTRPGISELAAAHAWLAGRGWSITRRLPAARTVRHARVLRKARTLRHSRSTAPRLTSLRTLIRRVTVHNAPNSHAPVVGTIRGSGTKVVITCYAIGSNVAGNSVWYRISAPEPGYISSYATATHLDPAPGVVQCPSFSRVYRTVVRGLHVRARATTASPILAVLKAVGTKVTVSCFSRGQDVFGDSVWYRIVAPRTGYVAGLNLNTGWDPASGVPRC